jgi:putative endonuclease
MYYVYLLASQRNGTLYVGVSNALVRRLAEHREGTASAFTRRHKVRLLVWFEVHDQVARAIEREKQIKGWNRAWKLKLIERENPQWLDLAESL